VTEIKSDRRDSKSIDLEHRLRYVCGIIVQIIEAILTKCVWWHIPFFIRFRPLFSRFLFLDNYSLSLAGNHMMGYPEITDRDSKALITVE